MIDVRVQRSKTHHGSARVYAVAIYAIAGAAILGWFIQHEVLGILARIVMVRP